MFGSCCAACCEDLRPGVTIMGFACHLAVHRVWGEEESGVIEEPGPKPFDGTALMPDRASSGRLSLDGVKILSIEKYAPTLFSPSKAASPQRQMKVPLGINVKGLWKSELPVELNQ